MSERDWLEVVGASCDWGDCNEDAIDVRYAPDLEQILPVCPQHAKLAA